VVGSLRELKAITKGPVYGFEYFDQHFLHGLDGSKDLKPVLEPDSEENVRVT
jgi:hypothetical protein